MNILLKILAAAFKYLAVAIYELLSAADISINNLIYNTNSPISQLALFVPNETQALLAQFYNLFTYIGMAMFIPILYWTGLSISKGGDSPQHKSMLKDKIMKSMLSMVYLYTMPELLTILVKINNALVSIFAGVGNNILGGNGDVIESYLLSATDVDIVGAVTALILVGLNLWMIFHYIIRNLTITFLFVFFPIIAIWYPLSGDMIKQWWKTLLGNLFTQPIHAIILTVVLGMGAATSGGESSFAQDLFTMVAFGSIIPISGVIKSMLGLETGIGAGASRAGFGGLLMATRVASGVLKDAGNAKEGMVDGIKQKADNKIAEESIEKNLSSETTGISLGRVEQSLPNTNVKAMENLNINTSQGKQEALAAIKRSNKQANRQIIKNVGSIAGGAFFGTAGTLIGAGMGNGRASAALGFMGAGAGSMAVRNIAGGTHFVASAVSGYQEHENNIKNLQVEEVANEIFKDEQSEELRTQKAIEYIKDNPDAYREIAENKYVGLYHEKLNGTDFQKQERKALLEKKKWEYIGTGPVANYLLEKIPLKYEKGTSEHGFHNMKPIKSSYTSLTPARKTQEELAEINNAILYQDKEKSIIYTPNADGGVGEILSLGSGEPTLIEPRYNPVNFNMDTSNIIPDDIMLSFSNMAEANAINYMSTAHNDVVMYSQQYNELFRERRNQIMREYIYNYQKNIDNIKSNLNVSNISIQANTEKLQYEQSINKNIQERKQKLAEAQEKLRQNTRIVTT